MHQQKRLAMHVNKEEEINAARLFSLYVVLQNISDWNTIYKFGIYVAHIFVW